MWSYYGRKKKIVKKYPFPEERTIIEPFAGTASYAYHYWENDIILIDSYHVIIDIWHYLQQATAKEILSLPNVENGENIDHHTQLCDEERWLIGFCINNGSSIPKRTAGRMNFNSWHRDRYNIAENLPKIRHWDFILGDYKSVKNIPAVWFIDPPYQNGGKYYRKSNKNFDYAALAEWSKSRKGQVIVCENTKGTWMDFKPLVEMSGQLHKTTEAIWTNTPNAN